jgi:hypothetical protein
MIFQCILARRIQNILIFIHVFTAVSCAAHTESSKIQNLKFLKLSIVSGCMSLFNTSTAQRISAYLAIIRCIKIAWEIAAL